MMLVMNRTSPAELALTLPRIRCRNTTFALGRWFTDVLRDGREMKTPTPLPFPFALLARQSLIVGTSCSSARSSGFGLEGSFVSGDG